MSFLNDQKIVLSCCNNSSLAPWTQALLQVAHDVEVKKQKEADKLEKRLAVKTENFATEVQKTLLARPSSVPMWNFRSLIWSNVYLVVLQETIMMEQVEGLVEEEDEDNANEEEEDVSVGGIVVAVKKTERQRRKKRAEILKVQQQFTLFFKDFNL